MAGDDGGSIFPHKLPYAVVFGIADIDRAICPDDGAMRAGQRVWAGLTGTCDCPHDPALCIDQPDDMILRINDEHVAIGIERPFLRGIEHCVSCVVVIAGIAASPGTGDGLYDAVVHAAQAAALSFQNVE